MKVSFDDKADAVRYAYDYLAAFPDAYLSITTTPQGKSVVCFAPTATDTSLDDTEQEQVARFFSATQVNT